MIQSRVNAGKKFEKSLETNDWKIKSKSPLMRWLGKGRYNIDKLINTPVSELKLDLSKSKFVKYDLYNDDEKIGREAKKYFKKNCTSWKLYSEPFFKISTKIGSKKISYHKYNKLIEDFYKHNLNNGLFDVVLKNITETSDGILVEDGFIPKNEIEFRTILLPEKWGNYHRITIQWRWIGKS
jgi:hypothetical protein